MKRTYKLLIVLLIMFFANKVVAAPAHTSFTDDQFYNCIIVKLNTDGFESNYNRDAATYKVTSTELASITVLKCNEANVTDIKGIELLTNLVDLNLSDNNISSINLASNTKITNLLLSNNKISSIDLSKNTALENLYLNGNKLSTLNLKSNRNLLVLNVNNNNLSELDLSNNDKLIDLKATNSAFKTFSKVVFKGESATLDQVIKFSSENENIQDWLTPTWSTKDANIATVNQKGTVKADKSGSVNIIASIDGVYNVTYNVKVAEIASETYNIDDVNNTIAVNDASIKTILNNITVTNAELMVYNTSNKYVTSGNITTGFTLKVMQGAQVLKTYTLTLVQAIVNNDLASLEVKGYTIDFDKDRTNYTVIVENEVEKVEVVAKAEEESANVKVEGNENLEDGNNAVTVTVTGKDNTTKTYTINVIRKASGEENPDTLTSNVYLEELTIKGYKISFNQKVDYYDLKIADDVKTLEITAKPSDDQASVEIKGNKDLKNKSKIEIIVKAHDGNQKVYTIAIQKNSGSNFKLILTILELFALLLLVVLCIVLIGKHKKKGKKAKTKTTKEEPKVEPKEELENTIEVSKEKIEKHTRSEAYLEKTVRFRRVCPKCGSVNVLTNDTCYLCGEKLDKE